jgi:hypothetical protein
MTETLEDRVWAEPSVFLIEARHLLSLPASRAECRTWKNSTSGTTVVEMSTPPPTAFFPAGQSALRRAVASPGTDAVVGTALTSW